MEALEFFIRSAVLKIGGGILEKLIEGVGAGRRDTPLLCPHCGAQMDSLGLRGKTMRTILGPVGFRRSLFQCPRCETTRCPGDEALGFNSGRFSPGMRRLMGRAGSRAPFEEAAEDLLVYGEIRVDGKSVEREAEEVGREIDHWMGEKGTEAQMLAVCEKHAPSLEDAPPIIYVSFDGTGVPVRRSEVAGRRGRQPDGSAKTREVKLGCVFTQMTTDEEGRPLRDPDSTTYVGAIETSREFGYRIRDEALRRGVSRAGKVVVLTDGAAYNKTIANEHFPHAIRILDLYHAREHLHAAMNQLWGEKHNKEIEEKWLAFLDAGQIETLTAEMQEALPRSGKRRKKLLGEIHYLKENAQQMRYREFRAQGLFVGSGVVEAGCKSLIGRRLKNPGMFWTVRGANAIIASRCCQYSGRYEQFWEDKAA